MHHGTVKEATSRRAWRQDVSAGHGHWGWVNRGNRGIGLRWEMMNIYETYMKHI